MIPFLFILFLTLSASAAPTAQRQNASLQSGLVGHWTMNAGSGLVVPDASPTGANGLFTNTVNTYVPRWTNGVVGLGVIYTNGNSGSFIWVNDNDAFSFNDGAGLAPMTVAMWVKTIAGGSRVNISKRVNSSGAATSEWQFITGAAGTTNFLFTRTIAGDAAGSGQAICRQTNGMTTETWHHIAATYDGDKTKTNVIMYLDGVMSGSTNQITVGAYTGMSNTPTPVTIGAADYQGTIVPAVGSQDDVRIYNRVLTSNEIWQLWGGGYGTH